MAEMLNALTKEVEIRTHVSVWGQNCYNHDFEYLRDWGNVHVNQKEHRIAYMAQYLKNS